MAQIFLHGQKNKEGKLVSGGGWNDSPQDRRMLSQHSQVKRPVERQETRL